MKSCLKAVSAAVLFTSASISFAAGNFEGLGIGVDAGVAKTKVKYSGYMGSQSASKTGGVAGLTVDYGIPLSENWIATVGANYTFTRNKTGSVHYQDNGNTYEVRAKVKQQFSVFVAPGYKVTPDLLVYAKVGYYYLKAEHTDTFFGSGTQDTTHGAAGGGIGVRYALTSHLELGAEAQYASFNKKHAALSEGKPVVTSFEASLKYRF